MNSQIDVTQIKGLTEEEVQQKRKQWGYNQLPSSKERSIFEIAFEVVKEPMFLLLVACGTIYFFLGELKEAIMLMGFVVVVIGITISQERKTEKALDSLRDLSSPRALVIRNYQQKRIPGKDVVVGDTIVVSEGNRVPADSELTWCMNLYLDESLLTGESEPVRKSHCSDDENNIKQIYSGSMVVRGQGIAKVIATGIHTEMGKIGKSLTEIEEETTHLKKEVYRLVKDIAIVGAVLCIMVVVVYGMTRLNWLEGFLAGITLAMAILPEEFPVVLTIFLALGAWRMSKKNVLTRRMPAIENLGAATVLCVDKTGTLTKNQMTLSSIYADGEFLDVSKKSDDILPEKFHQLVEFSMLASQKDPFDPMEISLKQMGLRFLEHTEHIHEDWELIYEYPLSEKLFALSHVWKSPEGSGYVIAAKGAPEAIADLCHMNQQQTEQILEKVRQMSEKGLRVLGAAKARFQKQNNLPDGQHDFEFKFVGLLGFEDPVRENISECIQTCKNAGIKVIMITGDYSGTALNIARKIGMDHKSKVITGAELNEMKEDELRERVKDVTIFARVVPEQKLRIVQILEANKEVVVMTGDGVNDAPALKAADVGIAMGGKGTDVARESADIVLVDDDFQSIVRAVTMGRRIYQNIKKAMVYIIAIHVPIAGISLFPVLFKLPLILFPVHIAFLELIIDPACSVVFEAEPEERNIMDLPPRDPEKPLFTRKNIVISLLQGLFVLAVIIGLYLFATGRGIAVENARAMVFTTLIIANLGLILTNRSWTDSIIRSFAIPNLALWWVIGGATVFLALVLSISFLRNLFSFSELSPDNLAIALIAGIISILWFEGIKKVYAPAVGRIRRK
ncbi:MAG: cation-translocating P-type ATPase [Vulcanimicrobiota bacterium]